MCFCCTWPLRTRSRVASARKIQLRARHCRWLRVKSLERARVRMNVRGDSEMVAVSVFGLGYVGSVTAACLAKLGNQVIGVDVNPAKVTTLNAGRSPIIEAQVDELTAEGCRSGRLRATTSAQEALHASEISFISV